MIKALASKLPLVALLASVNAFASSGAHGEAHAVEIPWTSIGVQAFNVIVLLVVLTVLLRKAVAMHFANRAKEYTALVQQAESAKKQAEARYREIKERMDNLEAGAEQSLVQARQEAEELKKKLATEAQTVSARLKTEAERTVATEIEKAKAELRHELLQSALATSHEVLKSSLSSSEQTKLQNEFVQKIEVVGG